MSTTAPVRSAIYLRVSLDSTGERLAVDRQREDCQKIAADRGWLVTAEYVDNSISASDKTKRRPAYDRLVEDYAAGAFDAILTWDLDRLTRQPRQLEDWIDAAEDRGLRLVTANGEADLSTDGGRTYARIKASIARGEVDRKGARQRRALRQRAENGKPPLGVRLTGYTTKGDVIPAEAALVREVFARFAAGESLRGIAEWINSEGITTRRSEAVMLRAARDKRELSAAERATIGASRWSPSTVRTILRNARYAGQSVYCGQTMATPGTWQPLVSADDFARVQHRITDPRRITNREGTDRKHLGSGVYLCSCKRKMRSWSGGRYRCAAGCYSRSGVEVDRLVHKLMQEKLSRPNLADLLAAKGDSEGAERLLIESKRLYGRLATIEADYDAGHIDGARYSAARGKVEAELEIAEGERVRLLAGTGPAAVLTAKRPALAFEAASLMIQRATVEFFADITLHAAPRGSKTFDRETVEVDWLV